MKATAFFGAKPLYGLHPATQGESRSLEPINAESEVTAASSTVDSADKRRNWLRSKIGQIPRGKISADELNIHFSAMPQHYWETVTESELDWGLETVHGFLELVASANAPATSPFVSWRPIDTTGKVRVMLCTWDRHGLLAKAAAAFSAVRLSIVQADVFTRADDVVLDTFTIAGADGQGPVNPSQMEQMVFLLEGALSEPPRFASVWACSRHKYLAPRAVAPPKIAFDNVSSLQNTIIKIEASDRLGLLYDILQAIADAGFNIKQARIETENNFARDAIDVTNAIGEKILEKQHLDSLRTSLISALMVSP